jgi:hypothetical protein
LSRQTKKISHDTKKNYGLVATAAAIPTADFTMWSTKSFPKPENI